MCVCVCVCVSGVGGRRVMGMGRWSMMFLFQSFFSSLMFFFAVFSACLLCRCLVEVIASYFLHGEC